MATLSHTVACNIFKFVQNNYPNVWTEMHFIIRPHKMKYIIQQFSKHLENVPDIEIFNTYSKNIPRFLLEFCKSANRNFLTTGDSYGLLLTCRCTKMYTQDTLDKRHLRDEALQGCSYDIEKKLHFEVNIYSCLSEIYEISSKRKFTTIFIENCTVEQLLEMAQSCFLKIQSGANKATTNENNHVYLSLQRFIIMESFVPNILKVIIKKSEDKDYVFRHVNPSNILGFTDLKYIYKKCGIVCYYFNLIQVVKLQFFKNLHPSGRNFKDICNILKYQCFTGEPLPLNRNGLRKNPNRSALEKICFEAVKQNYVSESLKDIVFPVNDSVSKIFFGQQFNEGTGYKFAILNKE